jgi:O-antigen/teichoic acid export membrane protein
MLAGVRRRLQTEFGMSAQRPVISLFRNASWGGLSATVRLVFGLASLLLSIRLLGAEAYGQMAVITASMAFYVALVNSVHTIAVTYAADCRKLPDAETRLLQLFSAVWLTTLVALCVLLVAAAFLSADFVRLFVDRSGDADAARLLRDLALLVAGMAGCQLLLGGSVAVVEGLARFDIAAIVQMAGPPLVFVLLVSAFLAFDSVSVLQVAACYVCGAFVEMVVALVLRWRMGYRGALLPSTASLSQLPQLLRDSLILQGAGLVNIFFDPFNKFLLNHFVGPGSVTAYDLATRIVTGIRSLFAGAFRVFLQLSDKLGSDGGDDYRKVLVYGMVPAVLMHGAAGALLTLLAQFWLDGEVTGIVVLYFLLVPASVGIIFASPPYTALIGVRDLRFIFSLHLNLAVVNLVASSLLIPAFGLYGAGAGVTIATAYNAIAVYNRFLRLIGPVRDIKQTVAEIRVSALVAGVLAFLVLLAALALSSSIHLLAAQVCLLGLISVALAREPLARRVIQALRARVRRESP